MKDFSKNAVVLGTAFCAVAMLNNPASATKTHKITNLNSSHQAPNTLVSNPTYTANGKMDKKTAVMLINLLRNPHLQVRASVNGQPLQTINPQIPTASIKNPTEVFINYTITGKTDRKTVMKLKKLMQNNKHISISAQMNIKPHQPQVVSAPRLQNYPQFIGGYTPFYSNQLPPIYVQGNTVWMPVPVKFSVAQSRSMATSPELIAGK